MNVLTLIHLDWNDKDFCIVIPVSDCEGGDLALMELGIVLELNNRDMVIFHSGELSLNLHYRGKRSSMVLHSDCSGDTWVVRSVRIRVLDARKMDGLELRNTLEGTGHGKGAESAERNEERGEMRNIYRKVKTWPQLICCALASQNIGVFRFMDRWSLWNNKGIVSGVMMQVRKRIRTGLLRLIEGQVTEGLVQLQASE